MLYCIFYYNRVLLSCCGYSTPNPSRLTLFLVWLRMFIFKTFTDCGTFCINCGNYTNDEQGPTTTLFISYFTLFLPLSTATMDTINNTNYAKCKLVNSRGD